MPGRGRRLAGPAGVIAFVIALSGPPATAAPSEAVGDSVRGHLAEMVDAQRIPGATVGVLDDAGNVSLEWMAGRDGNGRTVDRDTPFLIGSVAKSMTATLVMQRVQRREVRVTDHIGDHLPWVADGRPTVEQLLTHTGGYSTADGLAVAERYDNSPGAIRRAAQDLDHSGTIGDYEYSDANYLVLGALIEQLSGRTFADVLAADLLTPLGMVHTGAATSDAAGLPPGHRYWWGHPRRYAPGFDESGGPFGYVVSTLGDLELYARAHAGHAPEILGTPLLSALHEARVRSGDDDYGYGWRVSGTPGSQTIQHTGATPGYFAHVLITQSGRSVVVLTNSYSEAVAPALASIAPDVVRILDGEAAEAPGDDPFLSAAPWVASVIAFLGALVVVLAWWRPRTRRLRRGLAAVGVVLCTAACLVPFAVGSSYRTVWIWAPDLAVGLIAGVVAWGAAAVTLIVRRLRPRRA